MWESGRNNDGFRGVNTVGTRVNLVLKARPQAPAPVKKAQQPQTRKFEAPGPPTGTATCAVDV